MQSNKATELPQSQLNSTDILAKSKELTSSSVSEKIVNYNRPSSYTFYQPTHSFSSVTPYTNKQYEKKEYHFVSESFSGNRSSGIRLVSHQSLERQNNQNQQKGYGFKILNSTPKFQTPQAKNKQDNCSYSSNSAINSVFATDKDTTDFSKLEVKRISSYDQKNQSTNPKMAQSTIVQQQSNISEDKSKSKQNQLGDYSNLRSSIIIQSNISLETLSHSELIKKIQTLQLKQKQLENRNYYLAQQLLSNQSQNRRYQQKCQQLNRSLQKYKKSQQSLKISRNIISTLNQKIARVSRQAEVNITNLQQKHKVQILELKHNHQEECKKLQSTIFELKLKLIDQTNTMEQSLSKVQEQFKIKFDKQCTNYQNQIYDLRKIAQISQNEIRRLNQIIINLENDLMKLDEQNMRMDQQIAKLLEQNQNSGEIVRSLRQQNQILTHQVSQTHLLFQDLKIQNLALKQRQQQIIQIKQNNNSNHSTDEQKGYLMSNISKYQRQIKNLTEQIEQFKTQTTLLKTEKDELLQQLQQKEGQVAKLNITKGSLMLQNLKFKQKFKKTTNQEFFTTQQDVQSQEIMNLKSQIAQVKVQLQKRKTESKQKDINLSQKQKELNDLNQIVIKREEELQKLKDQYTNQKQQQQIKFQKIQLEWSTQYEYLQRQLQLALQKQIIIQSGQLQQQNNEQNQLIVRLQQKDQKIRLLFQQLQKSSRHIQQQTIQIINLRQQITQSNDKQELLKQMDIANSQLKNKLKEQTASYEGNRVEYIQTIEKQNIKIKQLQQIIEMQNQQSPMQIEQQSQLKQSTDEFQRQRLANLELQLRNSMQIIEQQKMTIEQLSMELQMQEKDYRTMVEQQINKISMIYSEQNNDLDSPLKANLPKIVQEPQCSLTQNQLQQQSSRSQNIQIQHMSRTSLINKISELQFIKKSLELKVQEINSMQQNLNDVIIDKLKNFEVNLQKNQQEKHQLQQKVFQLTNQLQVMVQKCQQYQNKIQWVDNLYKEVQSSLSDTIQELIKTQALYFNLKLQVQNCKQYIQIQNVFQIQTQNLKNIKEDRAVQSQIDTAQKYLYNQKIQEKLVVEEEQLENYQITGNDLEEFQAKYYVKEAKHEGQIYQIIVSQACSESQQQQQIYKQQDFDDELLQCWPHEVDYVDGRMAKLEEVKDRWKGIHKKQQKQVELEVQSKTQCFQCAQENPMSNYILNIINNLQVKQNQNIVKQEKEDFFKTLYQEQILEIEQTYKQDVQIQKILNHL